MKNNKNVRKDNLSPVENGSKRIYKMYKSKKNWVVAPVVLLTLLGAVAPAPIALTNVVNAEETQTSTVTKDVLDARADATTKIKGLEGLTDAQKTTYLEAVASASSVDAALEQVKSAYTAAVQKAKNDFDAEADKVTKELTDNQSTTYASIDVTTYTKRVSDAKKAVSDAFNVFKSTDAATKNRLVVTAGNSAEFVAAEDNYATVARPAFDKVLEAQKAELAKVLPEAKQAVKVNTDYAAKKADVLNQISKLAYLSATEKNKFAAQVAVIDADYTKDPTTNWKDRLENALEAAINANDANKNVQVTTAYNKVMALFNDVVSVNDLTKPTTEQLAADKVISVAHKTALLAKINKANTDKDIAQLNALVNDVNATIAADSLEVFKSGYRNVINVDKDLTAAERDTFITKITNSTNAKDVVTAYNEYLDFKEVKSLKGLNLVNVKSTVTSKLEALKDNQTAGNLTALEVGNYQFAVKTAESVDEVINLFQQAQKANRQRLVDAKDQATSTIKALKYLSEDQKAPYLLSVENATKATAVETVVTNAKNADKDAEIAITAEKAVDTVKSLKYLSATDEYVNAIRAVDHTSKDPYGDIQKQVDLAVKANYAAGVNDTNKSLDEIKNIAKEAINALPALSETEKATAIKDVDAAKDRTAVQTAFNSANALNDKNEEARKVAKELADAKAQLVKDINADKYLTSAQKADLVANANAATHTEALNKVRQAFNEASAAAEEAHNKLEAAKTNAINTIRAKKYLTATQQADYVRDILNAQSIPAVNNILKDASITNLNQIDDLDEFETAAKAEIESAKATYLNENQATGLKAALTNAKTLADKKAAFKAAIEQADSQNDKLVMKELDALIKAGFYETAKTRLDGLRVQSNYTAYASKIDSLLALRDAKDKARQEIEKADYVSQTAKDNLLNSVNKATSIEDVNKVLDQLHATQPAEAVQLYRAYNPNSGEHLYTADKAEYDHLVSLGWKGEGDAWKAASKGAPVYRLYNPNSGEHFYTISESEYNDVAKAGWKKEGVAFYSDANKGVEVFRLFNPNAKGAGSHHYTTLASERDDLIKAGWKYENVAFFGLK